MYKVQLVSLYEKNKFKIKYNGKEFGLEEQLNKIIILDNDSFYFDIIWDEKSTNFKINLSKDFVNPIIIDLDGNLDQKRYNIESTTLAYNSKIMKELIIQKGQNEIIIGFPENNLKIGQILILNSDLNFKLFFREIIIKENFKIVSNKILPNKENKLLPQKRIAESNYEFFYNKKKEIQFNIDLNEIRGNNIRFCLHQFNNNSIMTIHDMSEDAKSYEIKFTTKQQLELLEKNIFLNINKIKENVKKSNSNNIKNINFQIIADKFNSDIIYYNLQNLNFEERHLLAFIDYSYKFICDYIKNVIEKIIKNLESKIDKYFYFIKSIIIESLSKFEYFNEYVKYILNKNNNNSKIKAKNLIIPKGDLSFKEKAKILSSILTIILNAPKFSLEQKIEFFDFKKNERNIYLDANNFALKIIDNLKTESILIKGNQKTLSRVKLDINKINYKFYSKQDNRKVFIIELMNLDELKFNLKKFFLII